MRTTTATGSLSIPPRRLVGWAVGFGIVLVALNLRPAVTSLGALLSEVQADIALTGAQAGLATTLPVMAFAAIGILAPRIAWAIGSLASMVAAEALLCLALALRAFAASEPWMLLVTTALAMAGIAIANVLLPVLVRQYFPRYLGVMTGVYTMALQLGSAAGAGLSVPLAQALGGWRGGLGIWLALAVAGVVPWVVAWAGARRPARVSRGGGQASGAASYGMGSMARTALGWALTVFFGMQALSAYVLMGWLPTIYQDAGLAPGLAGVMLAVVMGVGAPVALVLPVVANRMRDQRPLTVIVTVSLACGYAGLLLAPAAGAWLWAVLLGVGSGAFPLALGLIGLRARTGTATATLSAFAQSIGYLMALIGPLGVGILREVTGGWTVPLVMLLVLLVPQLFGGLVCGRTDFIEDRLEARAAATRVEEGR